MNRNRIRICGRNTSTLPTPEITPFCDEALQQSGRHASPGPTRRARRSRRDQVHHRLRPGEHRLEHHEQERRAGSAGRRPDAAARASMRAGQRVGTSAASSRRRAGCGRLRAASRAARRRRAAARYSRVAGGASCSTSSSSAQQLVGAAAAHRDRGHHRHAELAPRAGRDRTRCRAGAAMSIMLSASISGRPTRLSSSTSRSASRRLVASATQTSMSGVGLAGEAAEHDVARHLLRPGCARAANRCRAGRSD